MKTQQLLQQLNEKQFASQLFKLYKDQSLLDYQYQRYSKAVNKYIELYGEDEVNIFSSAGRSEICGNHTDHQNGKIIAASINLDAIAIVSKQEQIINIVSDGATLKPIDVNDLSYHENLKGTSEGLVVGVLSRLKDLGYTINGFKAYITSDVLIGAGLSSSACFETLIGTIVSYLYNEGKISKVEIAKASQYSENVFFGKPCGLMDQCACIMGGLVYIDFKDKENPYIETLSSQCFDGYHLAVIDTKASHENLTDCYASLPNGMKEVAHYFNKEVLSQVDENDFYQHIAEIRKTVSDEAILKAHHYYLEMENVKNFKHALENQDIQGILNCMNISGNSSYKYLQNVIVPFDLANQPLSLALAISEKALKGQGATRVHGGGFAGTILAIVPDNLLTDYKNQMENIFGKDSCHILMINDYGNCLVIE